jgi:hypothetical protein
MAKNPTAPEAAPIRLARSQVTHGVPDAVKILIADAVLDFAAMEAAVEVFIWEMTGLSFDDGRMLVRSDAKAKFELAKRLSEKYGVLAPVVNRGETTMWRAMVDLAEPRNKIVHSVWVMIDLKTPAAVSYRIPSEPDQIAAESFSEDRLRAFSRQCRKIKDCLDHMVSEAHKSRTTRSAPAGHSKRPPQPVPTSSV